MNKLLIDVDAIYKNKIVNTSNIVMFIVKLKIDVDGLIIPDRIYNILKKYNIVKANLCTLVDKNDPTAVELIGKYNIIGDNGYLGGSYVSPSLAILIPNKDNKLLSTLKLMI